MWDDGPEESEMDLLHKAACSKPTKFCKDCARFKPPDRCRMKSRSRIDFVTGETVWKHEDHPASKLRGWHNRGTCGPAAIAFEPMKQTDDAGDS